MKAMLRIVAVAVVVLACCHDACSDGDALRKVLAPGGVAFQWPAPGSWNAPRKAQSENLLKGGDAEGDAQELRKLGGWHIAKWLGSKARGDYPLPGTPTADIADGMGRNGSRAFHLRMSADASPIVTAVWATNVIAAGAGPYRLSGWVRCGPLSKNGGSLEVTFQSRKKTGELCGEAWQAQRSKKTLVTVPPGDGHEFHVDVMSMPDIGRISLILAQRGPGELYVDDLSLAKMQPDPDIHVRAACSGLLDGMVAVGSREFFCGGMWARNETGREIQSPRLELDLPEGVRLVPPTSRKAKDLREEKRTAEGVARVRASIPWEIGRMLKFKSFPSGVYELYGLYADLPPRAEPYRARARVTGDGYEGPWWDFKLMILPRIEPVAPPKRMLLAGAIVRELEGQAARDFVQAYRRWGMNAGMCCYETDDLRKVLADSDLYMVSIDWFWRNNFQLMHKKWSRELVPKDGWWVGRDGGAWGMCPEYIAQGRATDTIIKPYYRKVFVEHDLYDSWCTNWEPNLWIRKGCFCPRCKKSFSAFAKLPEGAVTALDGKDLVKKWPAQWQAYRRDLNNRLMRLAYRIFDELGKERGRPIPALLAVGPRAVVEAKGEMEIQPVLRECAGISGWSYEGVDISQGAKGTVNHLKVAEQTEEVMEAIRRLNQRRDFEYYHTLLGAFGGYVSTPEEMELDFLCSVLARPRLLKVWAFPVSYDYRYARAFARAARTIAAHEDMIYDGEKSKNVPLTPLSPTHTGEETRKNLWARSFAKDGKRLYALFNFDRDHRVFFMLKPEAGDGKWVLHDPVQRIIFDAEGNPADGYCLHLGAARAMFLLLEPEGDAKQWQNYERVACKAIRSAFGRKRR